MCQALVQTEVGAMDTIVDQFRADCGIWIGPTTSAENEAAVQPAICQYNQTCLVITYAHTGELRVAISRFGWAGDQTSTMYETVQNSPKTQTLWADTRRRCLVPVKAFLVDGVRFSFQNNKNLDPSDQRFHYLAGLRDENNRFVVLSSAAKETVAPFSRRQPLFIPAEFALEYLGTQGLSFFDLDHIMTYQVPLTA